MTQSNQAATQNQGQTSTQLKKFQEETVNRVLSQVKQYQEDGGLNLPNDYSPANALKAAWFKLLETKDKNDKSVLQSCTTTSIANALMKMATEGLSVQKNQCSFIAYGSTLTMQREYFGTIALAKRYNPDIKRITANIIYQGDDFQFEISPETGMRRVVKHIQEIDNIDTNKIKGAYATIIFTDGTSEMEPMTLSQIQKAWEMGANRGNSKAHKMFADQMAKKTVINRICKPYINSSDDAVLMSDNRLNSNQEISDKENSETLDIEAEEYKEEQTNEAVPDPSDNINTQPKKQPEPEPKKQPGNKVNAEVPNELSFD